MPRRGHATPWPRGWLRSSTRWRPAGSFDFADCSVGNLVFAGGYLRARTAVQRRGRRLRGARRPAGRADRERHRRHQRAPRRRSTSTAASWDARPTSSTPTRQNRIRDIFLLPAPLDAGGVRRAGQGGERSRPSRSWHGRSVAPPLNPRLAGAPRGGRPDRLRAGHAAFEPVSVLPDRRTERRDRRQPRAVKLLVTNIQADAEITGSSAVDIIERAVYYLKDKGRLADADAVPDHALSAQRPAACRASATPYVPLGRLDSLRGSAPRAVGKYEQSGSGRHDAAKVLGPFVAALLVAPPRAPARGGPAARRRVGRQAGADAARDGSRRAGAITRSTSTVFCETTEPLDRAFVSGLPFTVTEVGPLGDAGRGSAPARGRSATAASTTSCCSSRRGCTTARTCRGSSRTCWRGRLDAVWGSRRLSVRDIEESYRLKYRQRALLGAVSRVGQPSCSASRISCSTAATSRTRCPARAPCARPTRCALPVGADPQAGQPASAVRPAAAEGGDVRGAGALLLAVAGAGAPHDRRATACAPSRRSSGGASVRRGWTIPPRRRARRPIRRRRGASVAAAAHRRALVIPAAGRGSRLGGAAPEGAGARRRPPDVVLARRPLSALRGRRRGRRAPVGARVRSRPPLAATGVAGVVVEQAEPTGMLDAVLLGCGGRGGMVARSPLGDVVRSGCRPSRRPWRGWRTRETGVGADAAARLARRRPTSTSIAMPRDASSAVRQRREGDAMPDAWRQRHGPVLAVGRGRGAATLPAFAASAAPDDGTGERNFLPFIPWLAARKRGRRPLPPPRTSRPSA